MCAHPLPGAGRCFLSLTKNMQGFLTGWSRRGSRTAGPVLPPRPGSSQALPILAGAAASAQVDSACSEPGPGPPTAGAVLPHLTRRGHFGPGGSEDAPTQVMTLFFCYCHILVPIFPLVSGGVRARCASQGSSFVPWGLSSVDETQSRAGSTVAWERGARTFRRAPLPLLLARRAPSVSSTLAPQKKQGRPEPPAHRGQQQNLCPHGTCQRTKSTKEILQTAGDKESQIQGGNFS